MFRSQAEGKDLLRGTMRSFITQEQEARNRVVVVRVHVYFMVVPFDLPCLEFRDAECRRPVDRTEERVVN